ncbi:MAG: hypothetical protein Kow0037_26750 [Calditrichia bacterium]
MARLGSSTTKFVLLALIVTLFFGLSTTFAQMDELEELESEQAPKVKCVPDSFTTIYDSWVQEDLDPQQVNIWYSLAKEEYKYKNYKRALPYYWKVLVNDKQKKFAKFVYSKLADCYYNLNQPDSVFLVVYRGLEEYPDNSYLHYWGGLVHDRLGHTECAIPHYEALTKADPKNKVYWSKLAFLYYKTENNAAIQAQQKVVELDPSDVEASRLLAEIMDHFGEDPLKARKATFEKDTTNIENALRYAKAAFERGLYKDAIRPYKIVNKMDPKNLTALEFLGRCYEGLGELQTAVKYYKDILSIDPKNINVMCLLASAYGRLHQFSTARSYVYKAIRLDASNGLPHMVMGEIYENAIQYCSEQRKENKLTYDDKLVYKMAQDEYRKAAKDPNYKNDAARRAGQLESLVPTKSDYFMQKNRTKTKEPCYSWIEN